MEKPCPRCKLPVPAGAAAAPFCSARCQQADLGAWLTEAYRIPTETPDQDEDGTPVSPTMPPPDGES